MANENIDIRIREDGSRVVKRNIQDVGDAGTRAATGIDTLKNALKGLGVAYLVRELVRLSDVFTNMQNRLRLVTTGTANLGRVTDELFNISNRTRSSFEATAQMYSRVALASKDFGVSQKDLLNFTEGLNQAVILSGASAIESENAMVQLSQGMASGALRGDELRSVLEQLPAVADVIAKHMGVTRGELRKLGADGAITTQIIIDSFIAARDELGGRFATTVSTVGQAMQVLRNNFLKTWGEFTQNSGLAAGLASAILLIGNHLSDILPLVIGVSVAFAAWHVAPIIALIKPIDMVRNAVLRLNLAMMANPYAAVAVAIITLISLFAAFADDIKVTRDGVVSLQDYFVAAFQLIVEWTGLSAKKFSDAWNTAIEMVKSRFGILTSMFTGFFTVLGIVTKLGINLFIGSFVFAFKAVGIAWESLKQQLTGGAPDFGAAIADAAKTSLTTDYVGKVVDIAKAANAAIIQRARENQVTTGGGALNPAGKNTITPDPGKADKEKMRQADVWAEYIKSLKDETALTGLSNRERMRAESLLGVENNLKRSLTKTERELANALLDELQAEMDKKSISDTIRDISAENESLMAQWNVRNALYAIKQKELELDRNLTDSEKEAIGSAVLYNQALRDQADVLDRIQAPQQQLQADVAALNALYARGAITAAQFAREQQNLGLATIEARISAGDGGFGDGFIASLARMSEAARNFRSSAGAAFGQFFADFSSGVGNAFGRAIVYSEDLGSALLDVARQALSKLIGSLVELGLQFAINAAIGAALGAAATTASAAQAGALATAWAPAAAFASLATLGTNAVPAAAGIASTVALTEALSFVGGFAGGGLIDGLGTGTSDSNLARVSDGEFIMNANATRRNLATLQAMNAGARPAAPGTAPRSAPASANVGGFGIGAINVAVDARGSQDPAEVARQTAEAVKQVAREIARGEIKDALRPGGTLSVRMGN